VEQQMTEEKEVIENILELNVITSVVFIVA
jgi:hypothetical protein